jgi:hypothetical protein
MSGDFNGVQARLKAANPYAWYVHCLAHRLQLALVAAALPILPITQMF